MPVWEGTTKATGIFFWEMLHIWTRNLLQTLKMLMEFLSSLLLNTYNELLKTLFRHTMHFARPMTLNDKKYPVQHSS